MNEYDSNRICDLVKKINYVVTKDIEEADCYLLNTCHIREKATEKVYHDIGRVKKSFRNKKKPIVLVTGCVAQAEGEILLKKEKYIDAVVGPQSYHEINKVIQNIENKSKKNNYTNFETIAKYDELKNIKNSSNNVSSFLTIQEGCDKFCKFCVVPYTRGPEFSRSIDEIAAEAHELVENGSKEIILLGQNVNAYYFEGKKLSDLINLLSDIRDLQRIRYTTSHPNDFTEDLLEVHKNCGKLMPLLHLPVQSGSSKILKNMNRNHTIEDYLKLIFSLKEKNSSLKFSSDFIIAYPGETNKDFEATLALMRQIKFINSYSFIYSKRPGTPAANMKTINPNVAKDRLKIFQETADQVKKEYRINLVDKETKVLFENKTINQNRYFGRDEYFNSVVVESEEKLIGKIKKVKIKNYNKNTLFGELTSDSNHREYAA